MKRVILLSLVAFGIYACATVAVTGRKQMALVNNAELITMANQQYSEVIAKGPLSRNAQQTEMIRRVGGRIQQAVERYMQEQGKAAELAGFAWEYNLIEDPETVNAWCMPGGKVAFYTGILPICKDETGVAIVMGHEIAHAIAHHGRERMSQQMAAQGIMNTVAVLMGENPTVGGNLLLQAVGAGSSLGILKFSRQHESEADYMGIIFMAMAGYDPQQAPLFWERMAQLSGGAAPPEFLSTHPSHDTRIRDLQGWIPEAMKYYKP